MRRQKMIVNDEKQYIWLNDWTKIDENETLKLKEFILGTNDPETNKLLNHDKYKEYFEEAFGLPQKSTPINMGLYLEKSMSEPTVKADRFAGIVPLIKKEKINFSEATPNPIIIVRPRFNASATKMLEYILRSDDFYESSEYIKFESKKVDEWKKYGIWNESELDGKKSNDMGTLFGIYKDFPEIEVFDIMKKEKDNFTGMSDMVGIFEIWEFILNVKNVCQKMLKQQSEKHTENFIGKVKGKIDIQKQIKKNLSHGRIDRNYCIYNKMTIDNLENRILKYALSICQVAMSNYPDIILEDLNYCKRALAPVRLVKCVPSDIKKIKNNGVFKYYKPAMESAAKIIKKTSISFDSSEPNTIDDFKKKVKPFFIQMDLLFELYCRALISQVIENNPELSKYKVEKYRKKYNIFESGKDPKGFSRKKIPDIIIMEKDTNKEIMVIDAKYSEMNDNGDKTFQILAYMFLLNCEFGGFISPKIEEENYIVEEMSVSGKKGFHMPVNMAPETDKENEKGIYDFLCHVLINDKGE